MFHGAFQAVSLQDHLAASPVTKKAPVILNAR
jgi:hypothetical protein